MDAQHRCKPRAPPLLDGARDDVQDGRPGHEEERECGEDEEPDRGRIRNHPFSSHTARRPSRVRKGSIRSIVSECGATRSASPPVATARASAPSSPRMRRTIPSTWPANPYTRPDCSPVTVVLPMTVGGAE